MTMMLKGFKLAIIVPILLAAQSAFADPIYDVTIDTGSISGTLGYLDLNFSPGILGSTGAAADVMNFQTDGILGGTPEIMGSVTGTLPGQVSLSDTAPSDYFHQLLFGSTISFQLELSGNPGGTFGCALYAEDQSTPLLSNDPSGWAFTVDMGQDGNVITNFTPNGEAAVALVYSAVPEPSSLLIVGIGLSALALLRKSKKAQLRGRA
jgi:hypothetical protein